MSPPLIGYRDRIMQQRSWSAGPSSYDVMETEGLRVRPRLASDASDITSKSSPRDRARTDSSSGTVPEQSPCSVSSTGTFIIRNDAVFASASSSASYDTADEDPQSVAISRSKGRYGRIGHLVRARLFHHCRGVHGRMVLGGLLVVVIVLIVFLVSR